MRFAFIIFKYFPYGGMQRDMLRTALELTKRGHTVEIFTMSWQGDLPNVTSPNCITVQVSPQTGLFNSTRYQQFIDGVFEQFKTVKYDFVFGYNRMAGLDAHFAADPCFIERAHQQRSFWYRLLPRYKWFAACEKAVFSAESSTQILAVSLSEQPHFKHWYGTQDAKFHYIPPYLSPTRFALKPKSETRAYLRQQFHFGVDDFVYLLTGSGFAMKGLDRAIRALAALPANLRANTRLVAVGQDNPKDFTHLAKKLGVAANVVISKGRSDTPQLMQGADVCVHPAYRENTGLVILEGMASHTPMLVTASCGYAHFVTDANAGLVCETPFEQDNFAALFAQMRVSEHLQTWADNGLKQAQQIMQENDGSAEAEILIKLAHIKLEVAKKAAHV